MSEATDTQSGAPGSWSVLARDNWETRDDLLVDLTDALSELDGVDDGAALYDSVEIEAVIAALLPESRSRGVSEVRFGFEGYEIRLDRDGVIAARPTPGGAKQLSA